MPFDCFVVVGLCPVLTSAFRAELEERLHDAIAHARTADVQPAAEIEARAWALPVASVPAAAAFAFSLLSRAKASSRDLAERMQIAAQVVPSCDDRRVLLKTARPMKEALSLLRAARPRQVLVSPGFALRASEVAFARVLRVRLERACAGQMTANRLAPILSPSRNARTRIDPTCGVRLDPEKAVARLTIGEETLHFCSADCMVGFRSHARRRSGTLKGTLRTAE